jgi:hypothetical protein
MSASAMRLAAIDAYPCENMLAADPSLQSGAHNKALDGLEPVRKCFRFAEPRESQTELKSAKHGKVTGAQ